MPGRKEYLNDIEESIKLGIENYLANTWTALPCIVTSVNLVAQTLEAQPAIQAKERQPDDTFKDITLPLVVDCPIVWPRAGGFALTFPIAIGDEVLIVFSDRCMDGWWQSGIVSPQIELRMHDLSDGFAILAPTSQPKRLSNISTDSVQLRNDDGDCFIEIKNDKAINIITSANVVVTAGGDASIVAENASISAVSMIELEAPTINIIGEDVSITAGTFSLSADTISTDGGAASLVQEVVAGDYISVDDSDRQRPIVTNTAPSI